MPNLRRLRPLALAALIFPATPTAFARQQQRQQTQPHRQSQLVESINITGLRLHARAGLLSRVETRLGDPFNREQVMRDFQTLLNLGLFDRRASRVVFETGLRGGVEIFFELRELPVVESVKFEGLRAGDRLLLREGLRRKGLEVRVGAVLDADKLTAAVAEMERLLRGRGWHNVSVGTRTDQITAASVRLTFAVSGLPPKRRPDRKRSDRLGRRDAIA